MSRLVVAPLATKYLFWKKVQSVNQLRQRLAEDRELGQQLQHLSWMTTMPVPTFFTPSPYTPPSGPALGSPQAGQMSSFLRTVSNLSSRASGRMGSPMTRALTLREEREMERTGPPSPSVSPPPTSRPPGSPLKMGSSNSSRGINLNGGMPGGSGSVGAPFTSSSPPQHPSSLYSGRMPWAASGPPGYSPAPPLSARQLHLESRSGSGTAGPLPTLAEPPITGASAPRSSRMASSPSPPRPPPPLAPLRDQQPTPQLPNPEPGFAASLSALVAKASRPDHSHAELSAELALLVDQRRLGRGGLVADGAGRRIYWNDAEADTVNKLADVTIAVHKDMLRRRFAAGPPPDAADRSGHLPGKGWQLPSSGMRAPAQQQRGERASFQLTTDPFTVPPSHLTRAMDRAGPVHVSTTGLQRATVNYNAGGFPPAGSATIPPSELRKVEPQVLYPEDLEEHLPSPYGKQKPHSSLQFQALGPISRPSVYPAAAEQAGNVAFVAGHASAYVDRSGGRENTYSGRSVKLQPLRTVVPSLPALVQGVQEQGQWLGQEQGQWQGEQLGQQLGQDHGQELGQEQWQWQGQEQGQWQGQEQGQWQEQEQGQEQGQWQGQGLGEVPEVGEVPWCGGVPGYEYGQEQEQEQGLGLGLGPEQQQQWAVDPGLA